MGCWAGDWRERGPVKYDQDSSGLPQYREVGFGRGREGGPDNRTSRNEKWPGPMVSHLSPSHTSRHPQGGPI